LKSLAATKKSGLKALMQSADLKLSQGPLQGHHVGFRLAPRLNAAGRIDSPQLALRLLLSNDADESLALASQLEMLNQQRKSLTSEAVRQAIRQVEKSSDLDRDCLVLAAHEEWHGGLLGLVASKLVERFNRPALALTLHEGKAHGSGLSVPGFDLHEMLESTRSLLLTGGGHAAACGLSLDESLLPAFRAAALEYAARHLSHEELAPTVFADCSIEAGHLEFRLVEDLGKLEPCGMGNPSPTLCLEGAKLESIRSLGQAGEHTKWSIKAGNQVLPALWWRSSDRACDFEAGQSVDLIFTPEINHFQGRSQLQLNIKDARAAHV
jgi:single-stranded-DNA-specific exonuclease